MDIARSGGIDLAVGVLRFHADSAAVAARACGALGNLAIYSNCRSAIVHAGGIPLVVDALRRHAECALLAERACSALGRFAESDSNQAAIAHAGAIPLIVSALISHANSSDVTEDANFALCILSWFHQANQEAIARAHGVTALVTALCSHVEHTYHARIVLLALAGVYSGSGIVDATAVANFRTCIPTLVATLRRHANDDTARACRDVLDVLSCCSETKAAVEAAGYQPRSLLRGIGDLIP